MKVSKSHITLARIRLASQINIRFDEISNISFLNEFSLFEFFKNILRLHIFIISHLFYSLLLNNNRLIAHALIIRLLIDIIRHYNILS